jgi:hypothetical protein
MPHCGRRRGSMQESPTDNTVFTFEKLSKAMEILVTSSSDARNRVFLSAEFLLQVTPQAVPESVREDIIWIRGMLKRKGDLKTTFLGTRNVTASKIAGRVFDVYFEMHDAVQLAVNTRFSAI